MMSALYTFAQHYTIAFVAALFLRFLWRYYSSPHRKIWTTLLDTLLEIPAVLQVGPWSSKPSMRNALRVAKARTKLRDSGPAGDVQFVHRVDHCKEVGLAKSKIKYSPAGQYFMQEGSIERLMDKLRFISYLERHPAIEKTKLKPPVFVIGFPRTGTTFLHELLGLHEAVRSHYTWEQLAFTPSTDKEDLDSLEADRKQRYNANKSKFNLVFKSLVDEKIQSIHRLDYDEPEECTIPCAMELPWGLMDIPLMVYAAEEIFPQGAGFAYSQYRKYLQLMTWQAKDRRDQDFTWMLKCPFHLPYLEELFEAFPGATVVWTHRDPAECIASACSLYENLLLMCCEESSFDPLTMGPAVLEYSRLALQKAQSTIEKFKDKINVVHVRYADTVKDPKKLCREVMQKANIPFSKQYETRLDEYLRSNEEKRKKLKEKAKTTVMHAYKPEDYGLTTDGIHSTFGAYIEKFNLLERKK